MATIGGDLRDMLLTHIRSMTGPWSRMPEEAQRNKIEVVEKSAHDAVRRIVHMVARKGFDQVPIVLGRFQSDGKIVKASIEATYNERHILALGDHVGKAAMLVLADAGGFLGESSSPAVDPDEPALV